MLAHADGAAVLADAYTGREHQIASDALVSVTCRTPDDALVADLRRAGFANVQAVGDAWNPGIIADAVFHGRLYAEEFDAPARAAGTTPFLREIIQLA